MRGWKIALACAGAMACAEAPGGERAASREERAAQSEERGAQSEERGAQSEERGAQSEERGAASEERGAASEERGAGSGEGDASGGERDGGARDGGAWAGASPPGLVDLRAAIEGLCFDIRYATPNNFTGAVLPGYEVPGAWLRREAADALARAQASLREHGVGVLVYDAYRPRRATRAMVAWAKTSGREDLLERGFIAEASAHARAATIDVGLCDLRTREALDLGTDFDAFVPQARHGGVAGEPGERREMLRDAMRAAGFSPYAREWWHYTMKLPTPGAALDVPYAAPP